MQTHVQTPEDEPLVDCKPVKQRLGQATNAFWRTVHNKGLPHYVINARVIKFKMSEVEAWLASRRVGGAN